MITKTKILIIKLGHSETLDPIISKECSLGDVVRTTVLLNYFKEGDNISWLCDEQAEPLLKDNNRIDRILIWGLETMVQLMQEHFDVVINLEKTPGLCALADKITAWQKYGFRLSAWKGEAEAHYSTEKVLEICHDPIKKDKNKKYWQEHLAKVINKHWSLKDTYLLPQRNQEAIYDVGLNFRFGTKWPDKGWPQDRWELLEKELKKLGRSTTLQPNLNLYAYMDWIASCRYIITNDSLGMHLALAYNRMVIALFGPTNAEEVFFYGKGKAIKADDGKMTSISVQKVLETLKELGAP